MNLPKFLFVDDGDYTDGPREFVIHNHWPRFIMTSLATVFGHFPLILVTGAGAAARNSIGLVLVGGMTIGTIFTLLIVPSLYMLIAKEQKKSA